MPELPEVETVVRALRPLLIGKIIRKTEVANPSTISGSPQSPRCMENAKIEDVRRRGKYIIISAHKSLGMAVHLRMTGWLGIRQDCQIETEPDPFVRMVWRLGKSPEGPMESLVFRDIRKFGRVWSGTMDEVLALKAISKLGPEPLEVRMEDFVMALVARRGRMKSLLLNQSFLAGLGNIYADEILYQARIHPEQIACRLRASSARRVFECIQDVLGRALSAGGSSIDDFRHPDGSPGWFQRTLKAYGNHGKPCARCGTHICRVVIGQRGSWYCPKCQRKQ